MLLDLAALRLGAVTAGFEPVKFDPDPELLNRYDLRGAVRRSRQRPLAIRPITDVAVPDRRASEPGRGSAPAIEYGPGDVTTIKFTSGSTGTPKGLAATVGSIDSSISAVQQMFDHGARAPASDNIFIFLPLSLLQQRYWVYSALAFGHDITISTYEAAFAVMGRVEPTVVMGVPGFFETAKKHIESRPADSRAAAAIKLFGGKIRYLWTGSAPARPSMLRFFTDLGLPIYEGYGLNETCIVAKNHPGAHREGSVGQVLPGKQVLLDADGVVSVRSDYPVNWRYEYAAPGDSERVFGPDGTVRTGDLGYLDDDGFLYIRGRADDVIVLDNGKKVIVRPLEEFLKASPAIDEAVIFCPAQTHLVAVVSAVGRPARRGRDLGAAGRGQRRIRRGRADQGPRDRARAVQHRQWPAYLAVQAAPAADHAGLREPDQWQAAAQWTHGSDQIAQPAAPSRKPAGVLGNRGLRQALRRGDDLADRHPGHPVHDAAGRDHHAERHRVPGRRARTR